MRQPAVLLRPRSVALVGMMAMGPTLMLADHTGDWYARLDDPRIVRVATFNASLAGRAEGELITRLEGKEDRQARRIAEIIQRVRPDILLINEFDWDREGRAIELFSHHYLAEPHNEANAAHESEPIEFPYFFTDEVNTGVSTGCDLDRDGQIGTQAGTAEYARDAKGFGRYPGQYGMVVFSRFSIDRQASRTFRHFLWKDLPNALLPDDPGTAAPRDWYSPKALEQLPLSSKSHWDVAISVHGRLLHFLVSHPTPPVFDGPEDRNGCRNHDEIRFWRDYIDPAAGQHLRDDRGVMGGLKRDDIFVIAGDLNSDPLDGDQTHHPSRLLLETKLINSSDSPYSDGGKLAATIQRGTNDKHQGPAEHDTGDFADENGPGNLRLDYVLPSAQCTIAQAKVFWPDLNDSLFALPGSYPDAASDHHLVWIDVLLP